MSELDEIIAKILLIEEKDIEDDLSRSDVEEWDSMTHLILISEIEQIYEFSFNDDEIAGISNIKDIKTILEKNRIKF